MHKALSNVAPSVQMVYIITLVLTLKFGCCFGVGYYYEFSYVLGNLPWLGIGVRCNGCPPHGCEDDEAIIHGFCCGCAYGLGKFTFLHETVLLKQTFWF